MRELVAEVLSIGDEMTSGQRLDTNSQYISGRLVDLGIQVRFHTTVGDDLSDNVDAFRTAARRADIVIATGGLGPTADDLTREALATAFNLPLEFRDDAWTHIVRLFAQRKRPMPERNRVQALFPQSSRIIDNPHGSAPGIDLTVSSQTEKASPRHCRIFALPGVPAEMRQMMESSVESRLVEEMGAGTSRWRYHTMKVFGIGESDVEKEMPDLIARDRVPRVGITVSQATITLRIAHRTSNDEEFQQCILPTVELIRRSLGQWVYAEGEIELHEAVHRMLLEQQIRLGVLEIGAGCPVAQMMSSLQCELQSDVPSYGLRVARWAADHREWGDGAMKVAESMLREHALDLCLVAGSYPALETVRTSTSLPYADFSMGLVRAGKPPRTTTVSLGGHPDVIYHRLAKTALQFLRIELLRG